MDHTVVARGEDPVGERLAHCVVVQHQCISTPRQQQQRSYTVPFVRHSSSPFITLQREVLCFIPRNLRPALFLASGSPVSPMPKSKPAKV
ncbi:hypothetical protein Mapa_008235 [Marchantia paleacea]|nr:hypothetical protein Mapa_008235 [Marchantia paleacea]